MVAQDRASGEGTLQGRFGGRPLRIVRKHGLGFPRPMML